MDQNTYKILAISYLQEHGKSNINDIYNYILENIGKTVGHTGKRYLREVITNRYKGSDIFDFKNPYVSLKPNYINKLSETKSVFPEEIISSTKYEEGSVKTVKVNIYERNTTAKLECLKHYGNTCKCEICGFKFSDKYGEKFKNKIHIHHIKPISEIGKNYIIDPAKDLIPVCPNCHMILHSKGNGETYSIEEVKAMIKNPI